MIRRLRVFLKVFDNKGHKLTPHELQLVVEAYVYLNDQETASISEIKEVKIELDKYNEDFNELEESKFGEGWEDAIDMIFGKHKLRLLLFGPTNDPLINGELFLINTIDDYVYEHTANMLYDTTHNLEKPLPCDRLIELNEIRCQKVKKKLWTTKYDVALTHKSKMKVFHDTKHRVKKSSNTNYVWLFKSRFKRHHGKINEKMVYLYKVKECIPHDLIRQSTVNDLMDDFQGSPLTYGPP
ncbi:unnamed protein product [Lactuca saligna]|uniref:Uncharacterized protein n=1 Tax=Lactuca saligna TaxID=75948 RepID=A0AA35YYV7_LACSI|nr:unnamed protein product [Lactuca saligna]